MEINNGKDVVTHRCGFCHKESSIDELTDIVFFRNYKIKICETCYRLLTFAALSALNTQRYDPEEDIKTLKKVYGKDLIEINNEEGER